MIGSFPRFVDIGMSLLKREGRAAVLQCEAASLGDYPAAETTEVAVDKEHALPSVSVTAK